MKLKASAASIPFMIPLLLIAASSEASVQRIKFTSRAGNRYLIVEVLKDSLLHYELSSFMPGPATDQPIYTTPMIAKQDYLGPRIFSQNGNTLETAELTLTVNPDNLCMSLVDKNKGAEVSVICGDSLDQTEKTLSINPEDMKHVYGLGQYHYDGSTADGDWYCRSWSPGAFGNEMMYTFGGGTGKTQLPVMYAMGGGKNYALFLDDAYRLTWDFSQHCSSSSSWWKVTTWGDRLRGYLITGNDLPALRSSYMELVGRPQVPPKKLTGLWMSKFGYSGWAETDSVINSVRNQSRFPLDGLALDLQWYGNNFGDNPNLHSKMGSLTFDSQNFPSAAEQVAYYDRQGIGLMPIEQSYVDHMTSEWSWAKSNGWLVHAAGGPFSDPASIGPNNWWGVGGMIDWTNPFARAAWHEGKRRPLMNMGIHMHWTDLGEPEMYDANATYYGLGEPGKRTGYNNHGDIHNLYGFMWMKGIDEGYERDGERSRHFTLARSGAAGMQRLGAGMWSGDLGADMSALRAHMNAQMHVSFAGIDYFASDAGGYHRQSADGGSMDEKNQNIQKLYTQWFANSSMFDWPVRPHVWHLNEDGYNRENQPNWMGDTKSNLANIRLRYELAPYYYTLAHRAYLYGEPVTPPLVFYYQNDENVASMGGEKLIGRDLLAGAVAGYDETQRPIYLPQGDWVDYHSNQWYSSSGQTFNSIAEYRDGTFRLPLFARAGAIIPKMKVDQFTANVLGKRMDYRWVDGKLQFIDMPPANDLYVRVFSSGSTNFTLFEDDGTTIDYRQGKVRHTMISQSAGTGSAAVTVAAAAGSYEGAPDARNNIVELVTRGGNASSVTLNGQALAACAQKQDLETKACYFNAGNHLVLASSGSASVGKAKAFVFLF